MLNELIETFKTRDSDVFICTYVKSGTTWTQQIINVVSMKCVCLQMSLSRGKYAPD